jgi:hypothetical protein
MEDYQMRILLVTAFVLVLGFHAAQAQTTPQYSTAGVPAWSQKISNGTFQYNSGAYVIR